MALAGISTLGVTFGYGIEATAGTKPTDFTQLTRINSIGGINIEPETIDASALEDLVERSVAGRATTGGAFSVTVNATPETITEWETLIEAYQETDLLTKWEFPIPGLFVPWNRHFLPQPRR